MTQIVKKGLKKKGVEIVVKASAKGVEETDTGVTVTYEAKGAEKRLSKLTMFSLRLVVVRIRMKSVSKNWVSNSLSAV